MSAPSNRDDPHADGGRANDRHETAQHDVASLALGEPVEPGVDEHVRTCVTCRLDLAAYRHVVELARTGKHAADVPPGPPPQVWDRISAELARSDVSVARPNVPTETTSVPADPPATAPRPDHRPVQPQLIVLRTRRWRHALAAAAAVVVLAASGVTGWAIGHRTAGPGAVRSSQAVLAAQPGTSPTASGKAVLHTAADGYTLSVAASGLPVPRGYYEVWLFNPSINQMVAVGTLGAGARGNFTVPDGIDLSAYHIVDVSAQKYDGNNTHERSVLRGPLQR